jgi:hypothetical protein
MLLYTSPLWNLAGRNAQTLQGNCDLHMSRLHGNEGADMDWLLA